MSIDGWRHLDEPITPADDTVDVVRLELDAECNRIDRLRSLLSTDEVARADRYKFDEPRRRFIVCRGVLRQLLGASLEREPVSLKFSYGPYGKPMLASDELVSSGHTSIEFSVSHSANLALIAVSLGRRVGVDIEQHDGKTRVHELAKRFFSPRETGELASLPECDLRAGFYRGWTSKEAYLKATGFGLSFSLSNFTVAMNPCQPARLVEVADLPNEAARWRMYSLDVSEHFSAALLVEAASHESVKVRQWCLGRGSECT